MKRRRRQRKPDTIERFNAKRRQVVSDNGGAASVPKPSFDDADQEVPGLLAGFPEASLWVGPDGVVLGAFAGHVASLPAGDLFRGKKLHELLGAAAETALESIQRARATKTPQAFDYTQVVSSIERRYEAWIAWVGDGLKLLLVTRDATDLGRIKNQIDGDVVERNDRSNSDDLSHDLNDLLTAIAGYSVLGLTERPEDQHTHELLDRIRGAAERGARLLRGAFDLEGAQVSERSPQEAATTFLDPSPRYTEADLSELTILLVEDEPMTRDVMSMVLRAAGCTVVEATNGIEAMKAVDEPGAGPIDLLLTDVVMPVMGGRELAAQLKERYPATRVLYTSGYPRGAVLGTDGVEGRDRFISKPFTPDALTRKVQETVAG